jgi:hypothetical protein
MLVLLGVTGNTVPETAQIALQSDHRWLLFSFKNRRSPALRDLRHACSVLGVYNLRAPGYKCRETQSIILGESCAGPLS